MCEYFLVTQPCGSTNAATLAIRMPPGGGRIGQVGLRVECWPKIQKSPNCRTLVVTPAIVFRKVKMVWLTSS